MTENDRDTGSARRIGNLVLYSLIAVLAAIAGFLVTMTSCGVGLTGAQPLQVVAVDKPAEKAAGSGFDKLVRTEQPKPLPMLTFTDGEGKQHKLEDWRGKVVLVNLWATWCAPCKVEMPSLDRLQAKLGGEDFAVVPISFDWSGPEKPRAFLKEEGLSNLPLYLDQSKEIMQKLGAIGLPLSVLVDREGREVARLAGTAEWDSPEAEAIIREAMKKDDGQ